MRTSRKRLKIRRLLSWTFAFGFGALAALFVYCAALFQELEPLMNQALKSRPSVLYSDIFVLRKDDARDDLFLPERLKDLKIPFEQAEDHVSWTARDFDYPDALLPADSPLRVAGGQKVKVVFEDGKVDEIEVEGDPREALALEPTPVAQISGSRQAIRDYVKLENIPTRLLQAIIAIEDQRFLEHPGFDLRGLARAVWVNVRQRAMSQGASTLTQQLIKNLLKSHEKTIFRKMRELVLAILMEARYSKDTILEKYLNEVYFGQIGALEVHGVAEAARYFYNKRLDELTLAEMALIAGVIRGPAVYSPYKYLQRSIDRKNTVLKKMEELHLIAKNELKQALSEKMTFAPPSLVNNKAPYFVDFVKAQVLDELPDRISAEDLSDQGLRIFTTVDLPLQRRADQAVAATVRELETRYKIERPLRLEGLLVAADPRSGYIRSLVGGRSYAETTFNRVLNMKRQVGSTFKPVAYLAAFLKGADLEGVPFSGAYMVDDEPWVYKYAGKSWSPRNYEKGYRGHITLREAFANSINIPMARIGIDVGLERVVETAHALGIREPLPAVPSLTLGSVDIKPLELLQVYATLANRGERTDLTAVRMIVDEHGRILARHVPRSERVFEPAVIDLVNDLLKSVVREGTAKALSAMGYKRLARGKTGTTSFSRDAWFAGFSADLVAVTWTGFDELKTPEEDDEESTRKFKSPAPLTGAGAALPTWARFFAAARPSNLDELEQPLDPALEFKRIDRSTGKLAKPTCPAESVYDELFLPGTAPTEECGAH